MSGDRAAAAIDLAERLVEHLVALDEPELAALANDLIVALLLRVRRGRGR